MRHQAPPPNPSSPTASPPAWSDAATQVSHRHIEVFRAVMTAASVTAAAQLLRTSQPTVSRELARLEQLLGYALFDRVRGRLRPNARALALWDEVQRSWQGLDRVVQRALALGRAEAAQLSVLCLPALAHGVMPGAAARWLRDHPQARLSITPQDGPLLDEWMSAQRFDLGLSEHPAAPPGTQAEVLYTADEVVVLPAHHRLRAQAVIRVEDLAGESFISLSPEDAYRRQIDQVLAQAGVQRHLRIETHSAAAVCAMVEQGLGVAIVNPLSAAWAARQCQGALVLRRWAATVPFCITAVQPLHRAPVPELPALLEALREELATQAEDVQAWLTSSRA